MQIRFRLTSFCYLSNIFVAHLSDTCLHISLHYNIKSTGSLKVFFTAIFKNGVTVICILHAVTAFIICFLYIVLVLIITALFAHEFRTCVPSIFLATYMLNDTRFTPYIMVRTFHFSNQFAFCLFHTLTPRLTSAFWIPAWTRTDAIFTAKNLTLSACLSTDNYTTYTGQYLPTASASIVQLARFAIVSYSLFLIPLHPHQRFDVFSHTLL